MWIGCTYNGTRLQVSDARSRARILKWCAIAYVDDLAGDGLGVGEREGHIAQSRRHGVTVDANQPQLRVDHNAGPSVSIAADAVDNLPMSHNWVSVL